jgi:hypothetical protein
VPATGLVGRRSDMAGKDVSGYISPADGGDTEENEGDDEGSSGRPGRKRARAAVRTPRRPPRGAATVDSVAGWSRVVQRQ